MVMTVMRMRVAPTMSIHLGITSKNATYVEVGKIADKFINNSEKDLNRPALTVEIFLVLYTF